MAKKRKNYTDEEKVVILRRHLLEKVAVSDLCDEYQLNPNVFYHWQKQFFENGTAAFQRRRRGPSPEAKKLAALEEKLAKKNEVIAELMEENIRSKKENAEL